MTDQQRQRDPTIADYLTIVRRYKWLIAVTALIVPVVAFAFSVQQDKVYRASADVLLSQQDLASVLSGIQATSTATDPDRYVRTQSELARIPTVASRALRNAGLTDISPSQLLLSSSVTPRENTDILAFSVDNQDGARAAVLATAYASAFTKYKLETDTASLTRARRELQSRLLELQGAGGSDSEAYRTLLQKSQDLRTLELLQTPATVIRPAEDAAQVEPRPKRNAALGLMLGLLLGIGGAFLLNAFDRRIWHADEVEREIQIPLLTKLPTPRRNEAATILDRSSDATTEATARLRASFDFANQSLGAKTVMITSAGPREGKSTTIANLAIALARTGRDVVLVDLDLRRPMLSRLFHLPDGPGITDFASRDTELADALQPVGVTPIRARVASIGGATETGQGRLEVMTTGRTRVEPAAFVESTGLSEALHTLRGHAEIVLIDAPPLLATGDSIALTGKVDAVLLVTRLGTLTRPRLHELARVLRRSPVPVLGLVATGAEVDESYSVYAVDEYYTQAARQPEVPPAPRLEEVAPEARSAAGGSTRWTPRRGG